MAVDSFGASVLWQGKGDVSEGWKLVKSDHIMLWYKVERVVFLNERGGCLIARSASSERMTGFPCSYCVPVEILLQVTEARWASFAEAHICGFKYYLWIMKLRRGGWACLSLTINREGSTCWVSYCVFVRRRKRDEDRHDINKMKGYTLLSEGIDGGARCGRGNAVRSEAQEGHAGGGREERGRRTGGPGRRSWEESRGLNSWEGA